MKLVKSAVLATLLSVSISYAGNGDTGSASLESSCLSKVVAAVNKHHTLAEGAVYALRVLYTGTFGSAVLVGHSDETDPTDYLVSVDRSKNCAIKSIVYAEEANHVTDYTKLETAAVDEIYAIQKKELVEKALELIEKVPQSGYDVRVLCITGDKVAAIVPMTHWSANDRKLATGNLASFPQKTVSDTNVIKIGKTRDLVKGDDRNGLFVATGYVNDKRADICIQESKPVLE